MWSNPQEAAGLVTITEGIFNGKPRFLCSVVTGPEPGTFGFQAQVVLWYIYSQSSQTWFQAQVRQTAIFLALHGISFSSWDQNSSCRFKLQSWSVIFAHITMKRFQNQFKLSLKKSRLADGNVKIICWIEINSLWCNIFSWNNLTKSKQPFKLCKWEQYF